MSKVVCVGSDHRGVLVRDSVVKLLTKQGYSCLVFGSENAEDIVDYPDIVRDITHNIKDSKAEFGVLICGTGVGVCMCANRKKGVRAVLADSLERVYFARRHEDANLLVFAGGYTDGHKTIKTPEYKFLEQALIEFENTAFEAGRHCERVAKLDK